MVDLAFERKKKGYTQEQLAVKCGVGRTQISNIEQGLNQPSVQVAKAIGEALKFKWYKLYE